MTNKQILKQLQKMKNLDDKNQKILDKLLKGIQENIAIEDFDKYSKKVQGITLPMLENSSNRRAGAFITKEDKQMITDTYRVILLDKPVKLPKIKQNKMIEEFYHRICNIPREEITLPSLKELTEAYSNAHNNSMFKRLVYSLGISDYGVNVLYVIEIMQILGKINSISYGFDKGKMLYLFFEGEHGNAALAPIKISPKEKGYVVEEYNDVFAECDWR